MQPEEVNGIGNVKLDGDDGIGNDLEDILRVDKAALIGNSFPPWDPGETVKDTLVQFADEGDVQVIFYQKVN